MPSSTPNMGMPYPLATEPVSQGDDAIKALAEKVDLEMSPAGASSTAVLNGFTGEILYRKRSRIVWVYLDANKNGWGAGESFFVLPIGFRPDRVIYLATMTKSSGAFHPVQILTNGTVQTVIGQPAGSVGYIGQCAFVLP